MPDPIPLAALADEAIAEQLRKLAQPRIIAYLRATLACLEAVAAGADPANAARNLTDTFANLGEGPLQ
jgi:hypothetical protein